VDSDAAFWIVVLLCTVVGIGLTLLFRLRGWF
jgi:hypothetical protein